MWRKLVLSIAAVSVVTGAVLLWSMEQKPAQAAAVPEHHVSAEGRIAVKPDRRAVLSAEIAGRVDRILVDNLTPVHRGQVLAELYNADLEQRIHEMEELVRKSEADFNELARGSRREDILEAQAHLERAKAAVDLASSNEERDRRLKDEGVISQSRYDATATEARQTAAEMQAAQEQYNRVVAGERAEKVEAARAQLASQKYALDALRAQHAKTILRSPLDGIVILRYRNASEFADVGKPVVEVADLSELIVEGDVNELDAGGVAVGQNAVITSDAYPGREFPGVVYEVSESLKRRSTDPEDPAVLVDQKILPIKVRILQPVPLKLGMKVDLRILPGSPETASVSSR